MRRGISLTLAAVLIVAACSGRNDPILAMEVESIALEPGQTAQIEYTVTPQDAAVVFDSANAAVAVVDSDGTVTALAPGEATINVGVLYQSATVSIVVTELEPAEPEELPPPVPPLTLTVAQTEYTLEIDDTAQLEAEANREGAVITFESADSQIATVDETGTITAVAPGKVVIAVRAEDPEEAEVSDAAEAASLYRARGGLESRSRHPALAPQVTVTVTVPEPPKPESSAPQTSTPAVAAAPSPEPDGRSGVEAFFASATVSVSSWTSSAVYFKEDWPEWIFYDDKGREVGRVAGSVNRAVGGYVSGGQGLLDAFNDYREVPRATIQLAQAPELSASGPVDSYAREVIRLINEERAVYGLSALSVNEGLMGAAHTRAQEIVGSFSHTRPNGGSGASLALSYGGGWGAENIAAGQSSPAEVVRDWMNSDGHRGNILDSRVRITGVGCYADAYGRYYWVQLFAG